MRYQPDSTPVERKSFAGLFFLLGVVSLLTAGWVVFNEFETRRPYKRYQNDFFELERARLRADVDEYAAQVTALGGDPERIEEIVAIDTTLTTAEIDGLARDALVKTYGDVDTFNREWAKVVIREGNVITFQIQQRTFSEAYWRNNLTVADLERMYEEEDGKLKVQKSLRDAEFYIYARDREAESEKRRFETSVAYRQRKIDTREATIQALTDVADEMRVWLSDFQKIKGVAAVNKEREALKGVSEELVAASKQLDATRKELSLVDYSLFEMLRNFQDAKRPGIRQIQLGDLGHEVNNVDRCLTCHFVADKPGYDWWLQMTVIAQPDSGIYLAELDPKTPNAPPKPNPQRLIGDFYGFNVTRPIQTGNHWGEAQVYVDGTRWYPSDGISLKKWRVEFTQTFYNAMKAANKLTGDGYIAPGTRIDVYQAYPILYRSHPNREKVFAAHPVDKFACISCHDGQGRATTWKDAGCDLRESTDNPNSPMYYWEAPMLVSLNKHAASIDTAKAQLEAQTQQRATPRQIAEALGIPVNAVFQYEADRDTFEEYRKDSNFHPKVNGYPTANFAESKCRHCHESVLELDMAPELSKGKRLFEKLGCVGCHYAGDYKRFPYDPNADYQEHRQSQVGPSLSWDAKLANLIGQPGFPNRGIGWKLNEQTGKQWLLNWLKDPRSYSPNTRMPNYRMTDREAEALTAFLWATTNGQMEQAPTASVNGANGSAKKVAANGTRSAQGTVRLVAMTPAPAEAGQSQASVALPTTPLDPAKVKQGELLVKNIGCLACHRIQESGGNYRGNTFGPDLSRVGAKVSRKFLEEWLENPRMYDPKTIMPSMFDNVPPEQRRQQIGAVAEYLMSQADTSWMQFKQDVQVTPQLVAEGERLFGPSGYGCVGCHFYEADIADAKGGTRHVGGKEWVGQQIGAELSDFGKKRPEVLDYGFAPHRTVVYYGDRSDIKWGELVKDNKDGSVVVRVPVEQRDPASAKGYFYKTKDQLTQITVGSEVPKTITKIEHTWHDWAFNKIKEPNIYTTEVSGTAQKMPNFYLTDDEAASLLVLLKSFVGPQHIPEAGLPHTEERDKRVERGRLLTQRYNCVGCHVIEESLVADGRLHKGWSYGRHTRDDAAQPVWPGPDGQEGTQDDIRANGWAVPAGARGSQQSVRPTYDRMHREKNVQDTTFSYLAENEEVLNPPTGKFGYQSPGSALTFMRAGYPVDSPNGRVHVQHGPVLAFAGERFRAEWLMEFLKRPYPVRQYLFLRNQGRMPYFHLTDEEVADLVAYFAALNDQPFPLETIDHRVQTELAAVGRQMYVNEAKCASGQCHPSAAPTLDNLAPNLVHSYRLKPEWIKRWITNPEAYWPGNGMPLFPWESNGVPLYPQYANGDVNAQMEGLRDYVLSLGRRP